MSLTFTNSLISCSCIASVTWKIRTKRVASKYCHSFVGFTGARGLKEQPVFIFELRNHKLRTIVRNSAHSTLRRIEVTELMLAFSCPIQYYTCIMFWTFAEEFHKHIIFFLPFEFVGIKSISTH